MTVGCLLLFIEEIYEMFSLFQVTNRQTPNPVSDVIISPSGQTLKKVCIHTTEKNSVIFTKHIFSTKYYFQVPIQALPPGVKPMALTRSKFD